MSSVTLFSPIAEDQEANVRPKRVAAVKSKRVIEDNIDDSDEDPHFKGSNDEESCSSHQSDEEQPEKKTKVTCKQIKIFLHKLRTAFQVVVNMSKWFTLLPLILKQSVQVASKSERKR